MSNKANTAAFANPPFFWDTLYVPKKLYRWVLSDIVVRRRCDYCPLGAIFYLFVRFFFTTKTSPKIALISTTH